MSEEQLEMFSREWYNEYFRRATFSAAHSHFCEQVYGKDLCQHGMMSVDELDFLISLIQPRSKILEIGCSNGYITEYICDRTQSEILGLDYSDVAINQAQERTKDKVGKLQFSRVDLTQDDVQQNDFDYIIMIDSIYFLDDLEETIKRFSQKLNPSGKMLITFFQAVEDGMDAALSPDNTDLAEVLKEQGFAYEWYDLTENIKLHWMKNYQAGEELREEFENEGNQFLYQARVAENRSFKEYVEKDAIVRYLYNIGQAHSDHSAAENGL